MGEDVGKSHSCGCCGKEGARQGKQASVCLVGMISVGSWVEGLPVAVQCLGDEGE